MAIKKETHYFKIDQICLKCGYNNKLNKIMNSPMNVIACGGCGDLLTTPDDMDPKEKKIVKEIVNEALKEAK